MDDGNKAAFERPRVAVQIVQEGVGAIVDPNETTWAELARAAGSLENTEAQVRSARPNVNGIAQGKGGLKGKAPDWSSGALELSESVV